MSQLTAWWRLGKWIWLVLLGSYSWVMCCLLIGDGEAVNRSGSIMVGAALVSELIFLNLGWRTTLSFIHHYDFADVHMQPQKPKHYEYVGRFYGSGNGLEGKSVKDDEGDRLSDLFALKIPNDSHSEEELREKFDFTRDKSNETPLCAWKFKDTARIVELTISCYIGGFAVVGTLVWGYWPTT